MAQQKNKKKKFKGGGSPAWMITYSDMVTLLLTFFVLLLSMSDIDKIKFVKAVGSLRGALGVMETSDFEDIYPIELLKKSTLFDERVQRVYEQIESRIEDLNINEDIEVVKDRGAVVLRLNNSILFDSGSSRLKPGADPVLFEVAELVRPLQLDLRIEGHTDDTPVLSAEYSNWDLSVERAVAVLKFFAQEKLVARDRLSAAGYGSQRPLVPNDSPEHRAMNRRVDLYLEQGEDYREQLPYLIDTRDQFPF
ncbi:MAG: flagellar motor protein MotB [Desulfovermiculus sp.]